MAHRTLRRQFELDNDVLEDLKEELIYGQRLAADEDGRVLVWTGDASTPPESTASLCATRKTASRYWPRHTP